jgi:hypothetical protein
LTNKENRVIWFFGKSSSALEEPLIMAHDALKKSNNSTIYRLVHNIIISQCQEIVQLRMCLMMFRYDGLDGPEFHDYGGKLF